MRVVRGVVIEEVLDVLRECFVGKPFQKMEKTHVENVAFLNSLGACAQDVPADETTSEISVMTSNVGTSALKDDFDCPEPHCSNTRSIVCDSEGRLHRNECLFAWARCLAAREGRTLTIMPESECETFTCTQNCSNDYQPVCSSDFITYPNRCFFHKAKCAGNEIDVLFNVAVSQEVTWYSATLFVTSFCDAEYTFEFPGNFEKKIGWD
uniref:Kazal-like domain-containing protein n=1 Tax=Parascaris equorum TaxID=6256 RepID=A0A914RX60_PAREQ